MSLPMRGEWIEISPKTRHNSRSWSLPMRGEWIEIDWNAMPCRSCKSLPMRGEWIEIPVAVGIADRMAVSPHAGRVD